MYVQKIDEHTKVKYQTPQLCRDANFQILISNQIFLCADLGTFIDFQSVLDHFAPIYALFQIVLAELKMASLIMCT